MDIFEEIATALQTEERVMLATVISTSGSTPAAALSKMLVRQNGIVSVGTVGGGCMEGDVLLHANRLHQTGKAEILTFHLNEDDVEHGLICGGSLDVLIEPITKKQLTFINELKSIRDDGEDCIVATFLDKNGKIQLKEIVRQQQSDKSNRLRDTWITEKIFSRYHQPINPTIQQSIVEILTKAHHRQETCRLKTEEGELILEPVAGNPSLVIFGGGHVSKYISRAASMIGFRITIVDDREKFANNIRFPEAATTLAVDFTEAFSQLTIKPSTYIVIVTRGHRYDEEILEQALKSPAKYIGMIGSKRKVLTTFEHLVERGITVESLKRVHAPIGIDIGAITAEEIGVSIVAELINARRGESFSLKHKSQEMTGLIALPRQKQLVS